MPFSTPPETGFIKGRGAGGGSLSATRTFLLDSADRFCRSPADGTDADTFNLSKEVCEGKAAASFLLFSVRFAAILELVWLFASTVGGLVGAGAEEFVGWSIFTIAASR